MAKRLTDSEKWKTPFFKSLPIEYKLLWFYIKDDCDFCGFWIPDFDVAQLRIGKQVTEIKAKELFKSEIQLMKNGAWFIPSFISEQYGIFSDKNAVHRRVKEVLHANGIVIGNVITNSVETPQSHTVDSGQEKEKEKEKELSNNDRKENQQTELPILWPSFDDFWNAYDKKNDRAKCEKAWSKLTQKEKEQIMAHVPLYVKSQPDKRYRKDPYSYIYNKSWNNEIYEQHTESRKPSGITAESAQQVLSKFGEVATRRNKHPAIQPNVGAGENTGHD